MFGGSIFLILSSLEQEYSFKTSDLGNYTVDITGRNDPELSVSHTFPLNSQHVVQLIVSQNEDGDLIVSQVRRREREREREGERERERERAAI